MTTTSVLLLLLLFFVAIAMHLRGHGGQAGGRGGSDGRGRR